MSNDNLDINYPRHIENVIDIKLTGKQLPLRIDVYLTNQVMYATRSKVQQAIDDGRVLINGKQVKASQKIQPFDHIQYKILKAPPIQLIPENLNLPILYEDDDLLVVNKPPNMCSHPSFGHRTGTLVNGLLYHFGRRDSIELTLENDEDEEEEINEGEIFASDEVRPGIVHRIDKDTSGLLVVAKNLFVHAELSKQFADRTTGREYHAIVWGNVKTDAGRIEGNIGRSTRNRQVFQVVAKGGKHAVTDYTVIERFPFATLMKFKLHTGRTHQIRVHCTHINHPLIGDVTYGGDKLLAGAGVSEMKKYAERILQLANRQMLHAKTLEFHHPIKNERMLFSSELPGDMRQVIEILREANSLFEAF